MKKLFLTVLTSALVSGGLFAQDTQDTTNFKGDSIMIRDQAQQAADETEDAIERTGDDMEQKADETRNDLREGTDAVQDDVNNAAEGAGSSIEEGAKETGEAIEQGVEETGAAIEEGAEKTGDAIQEGAQKAGDAIESGVEATGDAMRDDEPKSNAAGEGIGTTTASGEQQSYGPMVDIVADKEGPNHEVVYKVNGEMFYVDREQKQLVKAEESNLKDAQNEAIIHEGGNTASDKK